MPKKFHSIFTKSQDHLFEVLERLRKRSGFQKDLGLLRSKFKIPLNGFADKPMGYETLGYNSFKYPKVWLKGIRQKYLIDLQNQISELLDKYNISLLNTYPNVFNWILFYNTYIITSDINTVISIDMVQAKKKIKNNDFVENFGFPVAILVSVDASRRDIEEYVGKNFSKIKIIQNRYKKISPHLQQVRLREQSNLNKQIYHLSKTYRPSEISKKLNDAHDTDIYTPRKISKTIYRNKRRAR